MGLCCLKRTEMGSRIIKFPRFPEQVCGSEPHEAVHLTSSSPKQLALKIWCHSCVKIRGNAVWESEISHSAHFSSDTGSDASSVRSLTGKHITNADRHIALINHNTINYLDIKTDIFQANVLPSAVRSHIRPIKGYNQGCPLLVDQTLVNEKRFGWSNII